MDDDKNPANEPQEVRFQSGRLGQRIARYLFATLLVVSAIEYVPSYLAREQALLLEIERQGARTLSVLLAENPEKLTQPLERHSKLVIARTPIVGFAVFRKDGEMVWSTGEKVDVRPDQILAGQRTSIMSFVFGETAFKRFNDGTRFETVWKQNDLGGPYRVTARLDSSPIQSPLSDYALTLLWQALAMAAFTTIVMLVVLNRSVLKPVTEIHHSIRGAGNDLGKAHEWTIENPTDGEIGELTIAVNQILRNVSENFRVVQKQNEKIRNEADLRQQAEEEARLKHRQLVEAIEAFPGGFAVFDAEDQLMLSNETWKEFHPDCDDLIVPGAKFEDILRAGIAAERKRGHFAYGAYWIKDRLEQHRNGTTDIERPFSTGRWMRSTERRTEDGGILGIWTDISERKAAEFEHEELQAQFFQAQKHEALGTLAGGIAHDFNNLLAIILGNAKLLEMDIPSEAPGREELDAISGAGNRAKTLVRQILSFARQDPGQFKLIDLYDVTEEALSLLRATLPKSITTEARVGRSANIHGDPTQMHQIVMNLCINARDAIDDQPGKLVIDLGEAYPALDWPASPDKGTDPEASAQRVVFQQIGNRSFMWMGTQPTNEHIRLTVSDDGSGIDPETFKKIFDPFFTTKDVGKGTGLGLAAVLGIIQSHGGSMHVQSTPGEGTKFEIRLPRQDVEIPVLVDEPLKEVEGSGRILVIDDEDQIVAVLRKSLERKGYAVTGMTDPARALEAVKNEPDRWDVVISDINMPGLTGIQIAQSIHSAIPDMPVILCSGSLELMPQHDLDDPYYNSVLEKPVQESDMFLAIQRGMAEKNAGREQ